MAFWTNVISGGELADGRTFHKTQATFQCKLCYICYAFLVGQLAAIIREWEGGGGGKWFEFLSGWES